MKDQELAAVLSYLKRLLADPGLEHAHQEGLRKGVRLLEEISRSGKLDRNKVVRAITLIAGTLVKMRPPAEDPTEPKFPTAARRVR